MYLLNAQFGCKAFAIIIQEALTNVRLRPVELTSVYFGLTPKIFTDNEYEGRRCVHPS